MIKSHRARFLFRLIRELTHHYTRAIIFGFFLGLGGSVALLRLYPIVIERLFMPVTRIGVVGEFSPTTLPISIQQLVSVGLTTTKEDGSAASGLAESWIATDSGKTYVFTLRDDLRWQSGKPVEAKDVNYNIKDVDFSAVGPNILKASLREPYSPFPTLLTKPIFQTGLMGFGSYEVSSIRLKGEYVQYLKLVPVSKGTSGDNQKVREYRFYRTEAQAITAYKRGDVDMIEDLSEPFDLETWGKSRVESHVRYDRIVTLFFNVKEPVLSEKSFRQALAYAVPTVNEERAISPISKRSWAYTDSVRRYSFDETQVQKLLKSSTTATQSGQLTLTTFSPYVPLAELIANSWNSMGIPTTVRVANDIAGGYQVLLTAQFVPPDPDQYPFWHSTQTLINSTGYGNVKIDKLLEDGRKELDPEKRKKIYADFARRLVEDAPAVFLFYPKSYTVSRQGLRP